MNLEQIAKDFNNSDFQTLNAFITHKAFRVLESIKRYRACIYADLRLKWRSAKSDLIPFVDNSLEVYRALLDKAQEELRYLLAMRKALTVGI